MTFITEAATIVYNMSDCPTTIIENLRANLGLGDGVALPTSFELSDDEKGNIDHPDAVPFSINLQGSSVFDSLPNGNRGESLTLRTRI